MKPFKRLPDNTWITPRNYRIRTRITGRKTLDAYRFHIGLSWLKWPFWTNQLLEAAALHDYLYESARTAAQYKVADQAFIEVAARNRLHPVKLALAWGAIRTRARLRLLFGA